MKTNAILAPGGVGAVGALMVSNLVLQTGAVYNWDYGNGKGDLVTVTGSLTVPTVATVSVSCASGWLPRSCVILATTAAVGNVSGWVVTGNGTTGSRVVAVGTTVVLTSPAHGTAIMFR